MVNKVPVTAVITSYNHFDFVAEAIDSALSQTVPLEEVIVVDDHSQDGSQELIKKKFGTHVSFIENSSNFGGARTTTIGVSRSTSKYTAILNSDDVWETQKTERQIDFLKRNESIGVFSKARIIDANSKIMGDPPGHYQSFQRTHPRDGSMLRHFFYFGNFLCHSSAIYETRFAKLANFYDNRFRQLPDFDLWVKLAKLGDLSVLPEDLVRYRYLASTNTSDAKNESNLLRTRLEHAFIFLSFFQNMSNETFLEFDAGRNNYLYDAGSRDRLMREFEILSSHPDYSLSEPARIAALFRLFNESSETKHENLLHKAAGEIDIFRLSGGSANASLGSLAFLKSLIFRLSRW